MVERRDLKNKKSSGSGKRPSVNRHQSIDMIDTLAMKRKKWGCNRIEEEQEGTTYFVLEMNMERKSEFHA